MVRLVCATPSETQTRYSVIIPCLNGGERLREILGALRSHTPAPERIIVIDSGTTDGSLDGAEASGVTVVALSGKFNHGSTRNQAAAWATSPALVFMTQDAVPNLSTMQRLLRPLALGEADAVFARQVAMPGATPLERFARERNYPPGDEEVSLNETPVGRRVTFSNACSAVRRDVFAALGGFPSHTIMNEDMLFAARAISVGYRVAYVPDAVVEHSHDYSVRQTFHRYFDIGVVFAQAAGELGEIDISGEGIRYVRELLTWLWRNGHYAWLPRAFLESAAKWVGTFLGRRYKRLPQSLVRHLSMHKGYWTRHD